MKCVHFEAGTLNTDGSGKNIDISSLGFTDPNDYTVILNSNINGTGQVNGCYIVSKTATTVRLSGAGGAGSAFYSIQILA